MILRPQPRRIQPPLGVTAKSGGIGAGLIAVTQPLDAPQLIYLNRARSLGGNFAYEHTDLSFITHEVQPSRWGMLHGVGQTLTNTEVSMPTALLNGKFAATGQASLVAILRSTAQDNGGDASVLLTRGSGGDAEHYPYIDDNLYLGSFHTSRWVNGVTPPTPITSPHMIAITSRSGVQQFFWNGVSQTTGAIAGVPNMADGRFGAGGYVYYLALWNRILTRPEIYSLYLNPWQLFERQQRVFVQGATGPADFDATGDLDAQSATIAGAGLHGRVSTGDLDSQAASVAGAGTVGRTSSGSLLSQAATVAGTGAISRAASGALQAQAALIEATVIINRMSAGVLSAQAAEILGEASSSSVSPGQGDTAQPRGRVPWLADIPQRRERSEAEVRRDRQRFGVLPPDAEAAIEEVAARQAERDEQDEQKRFDELYRELELRRIEFDARYLEVLGALREDYLEAAREAHRRRLRDEQDLLVLLMLAAAAS